MLGNYGIIRWHLDQQGLLPDRFKENFTPDSPSNPDAPEGEWVPWTQPVFYSNTTWGSVAASHTNNGEPYAALDGRYANVSDYTHAWNVPNGVYSGWWQWAFLYKLRVRSIKIYQRSWNGQHSTYYATVTTIDESEVLFDSAAIPQSENGFVELVFDEPRVLDGIRISITGTQFCGIGEVEIDADCNYSQPINKFYAPAFSSGSNQG